MPDRGSVPNWAKTVTVTNTSPLTQVLNWWKRAVHSAAVEYFFLATIVCIALVVGTTNLATALYVDSDTPSAAAPTYVNDGGTQKDS
jgi:hypothetical protein